jgi:uncharacterized membrane protein
MIVHFPLALVLSGAVLLLTARLVRGDAAARVTAIVGTWNLCLGAAAAVLALATGLAAVLHLHVSAAARQAISLHLKWAIFTTLALLLLAVWRGAGTRQESRPSWLFITILLAASAALVMTGYRGGQNVYRFGVGVGVGAGIDVGVGAGASFSAGAGPGAVRLLLPHGALSQARSPQCVRRTECGAPWQLGDGDYCVGISPVKYVST